MLEMSDSNISVTDVADHLDNVHHHGHYISATCPFHDDANPSLLVFDDGWYKCLGCGAQGRIEYLYKKVRNQLGKRSVKPRLPWLPTEVTEQINFLERANLFLLNNPFLHDYLIERRINQLIQSCKLGWFDGWYTIPFTTLDGGFGGFAMRANPTLQKQIKRRYIMPPNQQPTLYCPNPTKTRTHKYLICVFGLIDAISLSPLYPVVTPTAGQLSLNSEWFDEVRKPIIVIPDKGEEEAADKLVSKLGWRGYTLHLDWHEYKDPNELLINMPNVLFADINSFIRRLL